MKKILCSLWLLALMFNASESNALPYTAYTCDALYSNRSVQDLTVNAMVTVPDSAPAGTVVWRMPTQDLGYNCWLGADSFYTYYFFNPANKDFGADIEVGVTINGVDYLPSSTKNKRAHYMFPNNISPGEISANDGKRYSVSLFILKKTSLNSTSKTVVVDLNNYIPYAIGKSDQAESGKLSVRLKGLSVTSIPCSSTVTVSPNAIDFGSISNTGAAPGLEIKRAAFSLIEQRVCQNTAVYGLSGVLRPAANSTLYDAMNTLVPNDNDSVGIGIFDADTKAQVPFNREFGVVPNVSTLNNLKRFEASLKWRTDTPKLGSFNAGVIFDVYYK